MHNSFFFFLGSILCISFASFVFLKGNTKNLNKTFFLYSFCLGLWLLCWALTFALNSHTLFLTRLMLIPAYFLPITFNMLANGFKNKQLLSNKEKWIHIIMLILFLSTWPTHLNIKTAEIIDNNLLFTFGPVYSFFGIYLLFGIGIGLFNLFDKIKLLPYQQQQQCKLCILGTTIGTLNGILFSFILPILDIIHLSKFTTLSSLWIVGFSFYAITKHKLMNINILISKTVSYVITGVIFILSIYFLSYLKQEYFSTTIIPNSVLILLSMTSGIIFFKLRTFIQNTTPLHLLERYNLAYFSKEILNLYVDCYDIDGFNTATNKFFTQHLGIKNCTIYINSNILDINNTSDTLMLNINNKSETFNHNNMFTQQLLFTNQLNLNNDQALEKLIKKYDTEIIFSIVNNDACLLNIWLSKSNQLDIKSIDPEVFNAITSQIIIALDRIKPFEKVKLKFNETKNIQTQQLKEKSKLETEYNIAKTIQERFLPKEIINIPGYKFDHIYTPSNYVGGDYFDIHSLGKEKIGFLICDVVGKGLEPSFTTIQLHSIFHSKIKLSDPPKMVMSKLNESIYQLRTQKNHCAAFYLSINPLTNEMSYSDAGNGLCYLIRNNQLIALNQYGGMILGAFHNSEYTQGEFKLEKDDFIFLTTDGTIDFKNEKSERFGITRMENLILDIALKKNKKELLNKAIHSFKTEQGLFPDDITILTINVTNNTAYNNTKTILSTHQTIH